MEFPIHNKLTSIDHQLLTDAEYEQLKAVAAQLFKDSSKGLSTGGAEFDRIYPKGYVNGYVAALANYPELAREVIAKAAN